MTWYTETDKPALDLTLPICATDTAGEHTYLLLPVNHDDGYKFRGYDWFNPATGEWNSCMHYATVEQAIKSYRNVRNCEIKIG